MADWYSAFSDLPTRYQLHVQAYQESQNVAGNYSTIRYNVWVEKTSGGGYYTGNGNATAGGNVGIANWSPYDFSAYGSKLLVSTTFNVAHNADGTGAATITGYASDPNNLGNANIGSQGLSLTTIPRATVPTLSVSNVDAGTLMTINLPRASGSFTHDITYAFGALTAQTTGLSPATGAGTSATFTPPLALLNQIPNAGSGVCAITVVTKNGATVIGTQTINLTVNVPASVIPTIGGLTISEATVSPDVATIVGRYVQNVSRLNVAITGEAGAYGSTITGYAFSVAGQTVNAASGTTPNPISASGTVTVNAVVTDSRGRTSTFAGVPITVLAYVAPTITALNLSRYNLAIPGPDAEAGTDLSVALTAVVQSLINGTQKNQIAVKIESSPAGLNTWQVHSNPIGYPGTGLSVSAPFVVPSGGARPPFDIDESFDIRVTITDVLGRTAVLVRTILTGTVLVDFDGNDGVGIGKYHEDGMLDVAGDIYQGGNLVVDFSDLASTTTPGIVQRATLLDALTGTGGALSEFASVGEMRKQSAIVYGQIDPLWTSGMPSVTLQSFEWAGTVVTPSAIPRNDWAIQPGSFVLMKQETFGFWTILGPADFSGGMVVDELRQIPFTFTGAGWGNWVLANVQDRQNFPKTRFTKTHDGIVFIEFNAVFNAGGAFAANTVIGTLPAGFRPDTYLRFTTDSNGGGPNTIEIRPNGDIVIPYAIPNALRSFLANNIAFPAAGVATWTTFTPGAGWSASATGTHGQPAYWKDPNGIVWWRGLIAKAGATANGEQIFVVPAAIAPARGAHFVLPSNATWNGTHYLRVNGGAGVGGGVNNMYLNPPATSGWLASLAGIHYPAMSTSLTFVAGPKYSSWTDFDLNHQPMMTALAPNGLVFGQGLVAGGSIGGTTTRMPPGHRGRREEFGQFGSLASDVDRILKINPTISADAYGRYVQYAVNGSLVPDIGSSTWFAYDNLVTIAQMPHRLGIGV